MTLYCLLPSSISALVQFFFIVVTIIIVIITIILIIDSENDLVVIIIIIVINLELSTGFFPGEKYLVKSHPKTSNF